MTTSRFDMALKQEGPPDTIREYFDGIDMNILKPNEISVFDNLYSKPSQMGVPVNFRFSMGVCFAVNGIIHFGQYDFVEGVWSSMPSDEKMRKFKDRVVQFWFYPPGSMDMFQRYHSEILAGTNADHTSRTKEYDPEEQESIEDEIPLDVPDRTRLET